MILVQLDIENPQIFHRGVYATLEEASQAADRLLDKIFPLDNDGFRTGPCVNLLAVFRDIETDEEIRRIGPCSF